MKTEEWLSVDLFEFQQHKSKSDLKKKFLSATTQDGQQPMRKTKNIENLFEVNVYGAATTDIAFAMSANLLECMRCSNGLNRRTRFTQD